MAKYTEKDAAKDTDVSIKEAHETWHQAREDAQKSGELPEREANKAAKADRDSSSSSDSGSSNSSDSGSSCSSDSGSGK